MIKIKLISVGKIKEKSMLGMIEEYLKRLSRYSKIDTVEINDLPVPANPTASDIELIISKEGKEIIKHINPKSLVVCLCIEGKKFSSEKFAEFIERSQSSYSELTFIIGSSHGLSDEVKGMGNLRFSMSDMTFPHNFAKLMLLEQIYRGFKINNNENYHK